MEVTQTMHQPINKHIANRVAEKIGECFDHQIEPDFIYGFLTTPPNLEMGHVAFPCFPLAKALRKGPPIISKTLCEALSADDIVAEVKQAGPYVNFYISKEAFGKNIVEAALDGSYFKQQLLARPIKIMVEYSQPNTHKELHVGHMRNLCLGDAIVRLNKYVGNNVTGTTYPGDSGTHVAKCLWYLKFRNTEDAPKTGKGEWLGKIYSRANLLLEDELGTEKEEENRKQLTNILHQLHAESGEFYELWKETRQWSLDLMQHTYDWAGVTFDRWFFESEVDQDSITYAKELFEQGKLEKDDGAIGMRLEDDKLGFCILIKSDGTGLYSTKDVELARKKFDEFGVEKSVYVVDNRQAFHFKQVFKVLEKIGFEQAKDCYHLQYEMVELPDGAMSSRKGNIVPLLQLISSMEKQIKENADFLGKYTGDWSQDEIETTASQIANAAIKYGMVRVDNNRKIVFNMDEWLDLRGETGPYLQYSQARIRSLVNKIEVDFSKADFSQLTSTQETALFVHLSQFNSVVFDAAKSMKTVGICSYLYELSKLFNSFYEACPIGTAENEGLKAARHKLADATGACLRTGLDLIGVPSPERM